MIIRLAGKFTLSTCKLDNWKDKRPQIHLYKKYGDVLFDELLIVLTGKSWAKLFECQVEDVLVC